MAYVKIPDALLVIGEPTKKEIFQSIQDNQEGFNTDIEALKQTAKIDIFDMRYTGGFLGQYSQAQLDNVAPTFKSPVDLTMVSFVVTLLTVSTGGNLEIELERSVDNGINWTPLLNSPVTVSTSTIGSISGAVDWIDVPSQTISQNDLLRARVTGIQVDQGDFHLSIYGELT